MAIKTGIIMLLLAGCITIKEAKNIKINSETPTIKLKGPIPKIVHQIWIGTSTLPEYFELYKKSFAKNAPDFSYKLWTNTDITKENFPLTYDYLIKASEAGKKSFGQDLNTWNNSPRKKLAQIADLMRLEIIYKMGGFYFDIKTELIKPMSNLLKEDITFIAANEDPCGLKCSVNGSEYLSNAFFAAVPSHPIIARLLDKHMLAAIDFKNPEINKTSGPFFFRQGITPNDAIYLLNTEWIYPYVNWKSPYRDPTKDACLSNVRHDLSASDDKIVSFTHQQQTVYAVFPCDLYPASTAVMHWSLGGTWK